MAPLLETQIVELKRVIRNKGFRLTEFSFDLHSASPTVSYLDFPGWWFTFSGSGNESFTYRPGQTQLQEANGSHDAFTLKLRHVTAWLDYLKRELRASEGEGAGEPPAWLPSVMPDRYSTVTAEMESLARERERMESMGRLLWETGDPLEEAVASLFSTLGFGCTRTQSGATFDLAVEIGKGRLLLEVTGTEGAIAKRSNKIGQILQTAHEESTEADRIVLVANVYRSRPVSERASEPPLTPEAQRLITRLGANFVTTASLFNVWLLSLSDREEAVQQIHRLHERDGEIIEVSNPFRNNK